MRKRISVGIIGDFDLSKVSHPATVDAIHHSARRPRRISSMSQIAVPGPGLQIRCLQSLRPY
jgi:hypothetical protein